MATVIEFTDGSLRLDLSPEEFLNVLGQIESLASDKKIRRRASKAADLLQRGKVKKAVKVFSSGDFEFELNNDEVLA